MTDLGDPKQVELRNRRVRQDATIRKEMLGAIMDLKQGRAWMAELLAWCHLHATSFSPDPLKMAFNEGERNIGLRILADLTSATPEQYAQMLKEQDDGRRTDAGPANDDGASGDASGAGEGI